MFNEINEGGLNQILSRRLGMPGGAAAPAVAPEIFPTLNLENDRPEWGWLKGERICARAVFVAAVAGQFSSLQIYLPSTSTEIIVIKSMTVLNTAAINVARAVGIGGGVAGWAAAQTGTRDFRWPGDRTSAIIETRAGVAGPTTFPLLVQFAGVAMARYDDPIIITPGTSLTITATPVNTALSMNLAWTERPAVPGELG